MKRITDKLVSFLSALAVTVAVLPFGTMLNAAAAETPISAAEDTSYYSYYNKYRAEVKPKTEVNADFGGKQSISHTFGSHVEKKQLLICPSSQLFLVIFILYCRLKKCKEK